MIPLNEAIAAEIAKSVGIEPEFFVDIWAEQGPEGRIDTASQWVGADDPMKASDTNVSFDRLSGSVTLGDGATVTAAYTAPVVSTQSLIWVGRVATVLGENTKTEIRRDAHKSVSFVSQSTRVLDSAVMRVANVGNYGAQGFLRVVDENRNLVGNTVLFALTGTKTNTTVSGIAASLHRGRRYFFEYGYVVPSAYSLPSYSDPVAVRTFTVNMQIDLYSPADTAWGVDLDPSTEGLQGVSTGGVEGYASSGSLYRQLDMGEVPTIAGVYSVSDVVPSGTSLIVTAWSTDDPARIADATTTLWDSRGVLQSGDELVAARWWRLKFDLISNASNDSSPEVADATIRYRPLPVTLGSNAKIEYEDYGIGYAYPWTYPLLAVRSTRIARQSIPAVNSISATNAKLSPKVAETITGLMSIVLTPEPEVERLMSTPLRGAAVRVRAGYVGVAETMDLYEGIVEDMSYANMAYTVTIIDDLSISDVRVPAGKAGVDWSSSGVYSVDDVRLYGTRSWICILAVGPSATAPPDDATHWADNGTVWDDVIYDATTAPDATAWHLAEIVEDVLTNRINMRTERIDLDSIAAIQAARTGYTGVRTLTKPTSGKALLAELAWLLDAQWVPRGKQLALIPEPSATDDPVENITGADIKAGLRFRRGWKELRNQCLILTGYEGDGDGEEWFSDGEVVSDATSISDYHDTAIMESFEDKWGMPSDKVIDRATRYVDKSNDGRRLVSFTAYFRIMRLEPGDLVTFQSESMPAGERGELKMMVLSKDMDFKAQTLNFTLMEV